ncbi:hypothetical protein STEG23_007451 [Scotinomys teguina]
MESTFWSVHVKQAWDSCPVAPETDPPLLPVFSEERGPWPLPFYPVLGVIPSDRSDDHEPLLQCPEDDFMEIDLMTDSSSEPDSLLAFVESDDHEPLLQCPEDDFMEIDLMTDSSSEPDSLLAFVESDDHEPLLQCPEDDFMEIDLMTDSSSEPDSLLAFVESDDHEPLLQCPEDDFMEIDLMTDSSSEPDSLLAFVEGHEQPATTARVEDSALEPVPEAELHQPWSSAPLRGGHESQDMETSERRSPGECGRPTTRDWRRGLRLISSILLRCIRRLIRRLIRCCVPRDCCISECGSSEL